MPLRIELRAITRQVVEGEVVAMSFQEVGYNRSFMIRCAIHNHDQKAVDRRAKVAQKSEKGVLGEIGCLHAIAERAARDQAKSFYTFVSSEGGGSRRLGDARPSLMNCALSRQTHFILKKDLRVCCPCQVRNLPSGRGFPVILRRRISQRQYPLWLLNAKTSSVQNLGDVVRVVSDAEVRPDDHCHPSRIPHVVGESGSDCAGIDQVVQQRELFFTHFCRTPRMRLGHQRFITVIKIIVDPIRHRAEGYAQAGSDFTLTVVARNHNQTSNTKYCVAGSRFLRFRRKLFQVAHRAWGQLQSSTISTHRHPPFFRSRVPSQRICSIIYA